MAITTTNHNELTTMSTISRDIVEYNILSRLDWLSLTSLSCTSTYFNEMLSKNSLWTHICTSEWPSLNHPRVQRLISEVPNGYRRLFLDSFPPLTPYDQPINPILPTLPPVLISAVDIWYGDKLLFSRVIETETNSSEFLSSPFQVEALGPKEVVQTTCVKMGRAKDDTWLSPRDLEENLTLSWIIFDPTTKRSANFSSTRPVTSERHWVPEEFNVQFATVLGCEQVGYVECQIMVSCAESEHGKLHVRDACMWVQNDDGNYLNGKTGLISVMNAMEFGKRKKRSENECKKIHDEFLGRKKLRWQKRVSKERMFQIASGVGVAAYVIMFMFYLAWTLK